MPVPTCCTAACCQGVLASCSARAVKQLCETCNATQHSVLPCYVCMHACVRATRCACKQQPQGQRAEHFQNIRPCAGSCQNCQRHVAYPLGTSCVCKPTLQRTRCWVNVHAHAGTSSGKVGPFITEVTQVCWDECLQGHRVCLRGIAASDDKKLHWQAALWPNHALPDSICKLHARVAHRMQGLRLQYWAVHRCMHVARHATSLEP